jgi:hypothetical protein
MLIREHSFTGKEMKMQRTKSNARNQSQNRLVSFVFAATLSLVSQAHTQETPGATAAGDLQDQMLAYAQCIRDNGYDEYPDPGPQGQIRFRVDPESTPRFRAAAEACRDQLPEAFNVFSRPNNSAESMESLVKLAECMRENGIDDFPDPTADGVFNLADKSADPGSVQMRTAMQTCQEAIEGSVLVRMTR